MLIPPQQWRQLLGEPAPPGSGSDELPGLRKKERVLFKDVHECIVNNKYFSVYTSTNPKHTAGVSILQPFTGF